ncbi:hypothetical protein DLR74_18240 [Vibrio paracholerae]|nr:hypothetical protein DLR74_18240 [Vibrio paracholerae]
MHNARLRGWQRINTKLKHNNRNHRGSMGLETLRVDSPTRLTCQHIVSAKNALICERVVNLTLLP